MPEKMFTTEPPRAPETEISPELKQKIAAEEAKLATLAQAVGADFGMAVKFGGLGKGSFFNLESGEITLDPQILVEGKEYLAEFVAGHEGGHRAITRSLEQIGVKKDKAQELYKKIGFGYLNNVVEDGADNDWVGKLFEKFKESSDKNYEEQFSHESGAMVTPEIQQIIAQLGYVPKFVAYGSEILRLWATGSRSSKLDEAVASALDKTEEHAREAWQEIPGVHAPEHQRIKKAIKRFQIVYEHLWPEMEKLVKMDIDEEKLRQMSEDMAKSGQSGEKGEGQGEGKSKLWGEMTEEEKNKLREAYNSLPKEARQKLEEQAKKTLEKIDDQMIKATRGKLADKAPPTHEETKEAEKAQSADEADKKERTEKEKKDTAERTKIEDDIKKTVEGELSEYDRVYKEVALLAEELYGRIKKIFLPRRHPRWEKSKATGQRLDLFKVMQFEMDKSLHDKLWEKKTKPERIDYNFTLLVDLSGSMDGEKIEQTFRGVVMLAEVLNRLNIRTQILGFQDTVIPYKDFDAPLSPALRQKMTVMRREVSNSGRHNQANWNSDGYCLERASAELAKQRGKDNFLLVFSDGQPVPDSAHNGAEYDLTKVVAKIRKNTKQKLVGIGLGPDTEHVKQYYPTSLPSLDLKKMPEFLGKLLEDAINNPERYK